MDHAITDTPAETILHGALELSKNSWLLALQFPDRAQPSLYPISGGDTVGLMAKLTAARDRWAKMSGKAPSIVLCYEAGYDAFWLARFLKARGIECLVVDAASMQVNRRARRAKTDRIDVGMDSGDVERSQGISRAGRGQVRGIIIQAAWLWLKHQPKSALTRWFVRRTAGQSGRIRRVMIVAVARKLALALWRFLEQGRVPQAARLASR